MLRFHTLSRTLINIIVVSLFLIPSNSNAQQNIQSELIERALKIEAVEDNFVLPRRDDPGETWIFYDDATARYYFNPVETWARVTFTARAEFKLWGVQIMAYNPERVDEPCYVRIYSEDQENHDLDSMLHEFEIEEVVNARWMWVEFEEDEDSLVFEAGEHFSIVYGPAPGGIPNEGAEGWWPLSDSGSVTERSFYASNEDPPDRHNRWTALGDIGDMLIRANGVYQGDFIDLGVNAVYNNEDPEERQWIVIKDTEVTLTAEIINYGADSEEFIVSFELVDSRGNEVIEAEVIVDGIEAGETMIVECDEIWEVESPYGLYELWVEAIAEDDIEDINNRKGLDQIVVHQVNSRDTWLGYTDGNDGLFWYFDDDGGGYGAMFYHPGTVYPFWLTDTRAMIEATEADINIECAVFLYDVSNNRADRIWTGSQNSRQETDWVEFNLEEDEYVMMEDGEAILILWFHEDGLLFRRSDLPPHAAAAIGMPRPMFITFDDGDELRSREDLDCAIQAKLSGPDSDYSGIVQGYVTDLETENPVEDAVVRTSDGNSVITDRDGFYRIRDWNDTTFDLTVTMQGYNDSTITVEDLAAEDTLIADFALRKPDFVIVVESVIGNVPPDSTDEESFEVMNFGNGPLEWSVTKAWTGELDFEPWDDRGEFDAGIEVRDTRLSGVAYAEGYFYVTGSANDTNKVYVIDENGDVVRNFPQPGDAARGMLDLAWDGEFLWGSGERNVHQFSIEGNVEAVIRGAWSPNRGLTWDSDRKLLWMCSSRTNIVGITAAGETVMEIERPEFTMSSLAYCPDDPDGYPLYIFHDDEDGNPLVHKVNPETGEYLPVRGLDVEGSPEGTFATNRYDPYNWIYIAMYDVSAENGGDRFELYQLHPNLSWMKVDPKFGVVLPDDENEITVLFDARGLLRDQYFGELIFQHNAMGGEFHLDVELNVFGGPRPPSPFNLRSPEDGSDVGSEDIEFSWYQSFDPNPGDVVSYILWLQTNDESVAVTTEETEYTVDMTEVELEFESGDRFDWWVVASSGDDEVECNNRFNFIYIPTDLDQSVIELPKEFAVQDAFPNPFNSSFTINYSIREAGQTVLRILDFSGKAVDVLDLGKLQAGYHTFSYEASKLPSGVYLTQLLNNNQVRIAKLVCIK